MFNVHIRTLAQYFNIRHMNYSYELLTMECINVQAESPITDLLGGHALEESDASCFEAEAVGSTSLSLPLLLLLFNRLRALERALTVSSQAGLSQSS